MKFFTFSDKARPVRLSESTRRFAFESLNRKYGLDTKRVDNIKLDHIADFEHYSDIEKYDIAIREIAKSAPIRICEGEKLSGAATLGLAIKHQVPATYKGEWTFKSISHVTIDFASTLKYGINKIACDIKERMQDDTLTERQNAFLHSAQNAIDAMRVWHARYLEALSVDSKYKQNLENLKRVPFEPARTFYEAVQAIWFQFAFVRLCGNWPGIGRIDHMLGEYLDYDLENGIITLDEAREIIAHFLIKGCEWVCGGNYGSGDAQHYQNLVLAGVDENGEEVTNKVTYLILDVLEEFNIGDFPTTVRLNRNTDEALLRRIAEVMRHGGGVLAIYNEEKIIASMTSHGYTLGEARSFANDGCWEVQVPGKTYFNYVALDAMQVLLNDTLRIREGGMHYEAFEDVKRAFFDHYERLIVKIRGIYADQIAKRNADGTWLAKPQTPCTVLSLFEGGCIENAASYLELGPIYNVISPHIGGAADAGNSLRAIDELCFKQKLISLDDLLKLLQNNWEGNEPLRQYALNKITYYGNDDDAADAYTADVVDGFARLVIKHNCDAPFAYVPGASTFGRQIEWTHYRPASPHGHRTGDVLAPNMGATPGTDMQSATALIKSYCKLHLTDQVTGAALDVKLLPSTVKGEEGIQALIALYRGFVALGGCFMQPDVVDNSILKDAQENPEDYASLSVRISGWNARFVTLDRAWQDMVIEKTTHGEV